MGAVIRAKHAQMPSVFKITLLPGLRMSVLDQLETKAQKGKGDHGCGDWCQVCTSARRLQEFAGPPENGHRQITLNCAEHDENDTRRRALHGAGSGNGNINAEHPQ